MSVPVAPVPPAASVRPKRWTPWAGWLGGALGWALHHQAGSDLVLWDCRLGGPLLSGGLGVVCLALAVAGGLVSWRVASEPGDPTTTAGRRFAALLSTGAAALLALTILAQSVSGFVYQTCQR